MSDRLIKLTNGETLEIGINFLTIKKLMETDYGHTDFKKIKDLESSEVIGLMADLIYCIMYSNGKKISKEDALQLVPVGDDDAFNDLIDEFSDKMEKFGKKVEARSKIEKVAR